jgi:hypothetical protein
LGEESYTWQRGCITKKKNWKRNKNYFQLFGFKNYYIITRKKINLVCIKKLNGLYDKIITELLQLIKFRMSVIRKSTNDAYIELGVIKLICD